MEKKLQMHQEPVFKKWLNAKNYLLALAMMAGVQGSTFAQNSDSSSENEDIVCKTFYTGSGFYYAANSIIKNEGDITKSFADYDILFEMGKGFEYSIGSDIKSYFGKAPILGSGALETSNSLFIDNPNSDIYTLGFPVEFTKGKMYRYKMQIFIQASEDCAQSVAKAWKNASFGVKYQHKPTDNDRIEIMAYDSKGEALNESKKEIVVSGFDERMPLSQVLDLEKINLGDIIRLEVLLYGSFPEEANNLKYFKMSPVLSEFTCSKVAVDYIASDYETYCTSSSITCKGEYTTANAVGFSRNSTYEWYKQNGDDWEKLEDISGTGDKYARPTILAENIGVNRYKLVVSNESEMNKELEFVVYGRNCTDVETLAADDNSIVSVYTVDGIVLKKNVTQSEAMKDLKRGLYIIGDKKVYVGQ